MEKVIPWGVGGGNLHLAYTGQDNGEIVITSDTENYTETERYEVLTVATGNGAVKERLTVRQPSRKAYVDGNMLVFTLAANVSVSGGNLVIEDTGISVRDDVIFI